MHTDKDRKSKQDIAGPHIEGGQAKFGEAVRQSADGLRAPDQPHGSLVDQDTAGKHEPAARSATNSEPNPAPEGVWRERKGPMNKSTGRR